MDQDKIHCVTQTFSTVVHSEFRSDHFLIVFKQAIKTEIQIVEAKKFGAKFKLMPALWHGIFTITMQFYKTYGSNSLVSVSKIGIDTTKNPWYRSGIVSI